jgi:hypothetical protein
MCSSLFNKPAKVMPTLSILLFSFIYNANYRDYRWICMSFVTAEQEISSHSVLHKNRILTLLKLPEEVLVKIRSHGDLMKKRFVTERKLRRECQLLGESITKTSYARHVKHLV